MYAQLGTTQFDTLLGPESFSHTVSPSFADLALVEGKPRTQRTGSNLDTISLGIRLHNAFCEPDAEYAALVAASELGDPLPFIMGNGTIVGTFTIRSITRDILQSTPTGTTVECVLSVELTEFVDPDAAQSAALKAQAAGLAMSANKPSKLKTAPAPTSDAVKVMQDVTDAKRQASFIGRLVDTAQRNAAKAARAYQQARRAVKKAEDALKKAEQGIQAAQRLQTQAVSAVNQIKQAQRNLQNVGTALTPPVDINDLVNANRSLQFSMSNVMSGTAPIAALGGTKRA